MDTFDKKVLKNIKCVLLDLDGTLYIDGDLIGDVGGTLRALRDDGKQIIFLTNNSSRDERTYVDKLSKMGIFDERDEVYTSARAAIEYLNANHKGKSAYVLACDAVKNSFIYSGIRVEENEQPDIAVLTYDRTIDYEKICKFDKFIKRGAFYVATHPDAVCPAKEVFLPDIGSFISMFEVSSGRRPDVITGKPFREMGNSIMRRHNVTPDQVLMVGDRLSTDILFGVNNNFYSLLVFSGETTRKQYDESDIRASFTLPSVNDLVKYL